MKYVLTLVILLTFASSSMAQNNCLEFDGTNDYVNCGINQSAFGADFTISAWVYPTVEMNYHGIGGSTGGPSGIVFGQYNTSG